ncbi:hypothetical protein EDD22DRAFT_842748 [Suillus occidentalis]|nr:hypothetical protein EDD22DRAFT_842748 [Suillus occidentalis]
MEIFDFIGSDSISSAKAFIKNHSYHYYMQFNNNDVPKPVRHKPYLGDLLVHLMKGHYFNGPKSIGTVYAALFWKAQGSPPKFNFTGNQFSEVYVFHVQFLEGMKTNAPHKFHKLMADIFAAIQDLMHIKKIATDSKDDALAFLDLDGMDE